MTDLLEVRKRLKDDYEFYGQHCVKIRTKDADIRPLVFNSPQRKFHQVIQGQLKATGSVRAIILKARQQGFSTYVSGRMYFRLSQRKAAKGLVVAHVAESTQSIFDMYKRIHAECPEAMRPSTKYSNRNELQFDKLDTSVMVATAGGKSIARGETLNNVHLSEMAFWPVATAKDNFNGLMKCVPNKPGTEVFIESTACGVTGPYHDMWQAAVKGENEFVPFFSPWFDTPEYQFPVPEGFERTYEEEDLVEQFGLDDGQLIFRRYEIGKNGLDLFKQEYPASPDEAFLTTGRPVFNPEQLHARLKEIEGRQPIARMAVDYGSVNENSRGELFVYHKLDPAGVYTIGADVGMGVRNGDYSVAQVLDHNGRQVAVWRGQVHPDRYADILNTLGFYYNTAKVAPERNNHGILTCVRLGRDLAYPNIYTEVGEGQLNDRETISIGFYTDVRTKPLIIDRLRGSCREKQLELNDPTTIREMLTYIVTESGKMEGSEGCHDDCVTSLAIANHCLERKFVPIEVSDDYYIDAI